MVRVGLHKILNQKIAVKIYEKFKLLEPNRRKSVKREIKIMEKIDHDCLAKLYEAFESHKQVFLIMEYVNGGSLHGYLKGKPNRQMAEIEAKFLWQQVAFGIHYLHQRNVTHRDIKLENILLDETRTRVKLIDFGFSTCIPHEKKVKIFCGTPSYMAPEIVSKIEYAGPPADIWALGVLLYALLCGRFPFKGQNDKELYSNICKQDLPIPDHISRSARQLLLKIFQKNPDKRPNVKDILRDPWLQFSTRDQEMMSPKSLAFVSHLKHISNINFGQGTKLALNRTMNNFNRQAIRQGSIDNHSNINFYIQSKDKRNQMFAPEVKQFILDDNMRRNIMSGQKHSGSHSAQHDNKVGSYVQQPQPGRYNLNDTMPVVSSSNFNIIKHTNNSTDLGPKTHMLQGTGSNTVLGLQDGSQAKHLNDKINMEAYQAYYNTNENTSAQANGPNIATIDGQQPYNNAEKPLNSEAYQNENETPQNMEIINNIMHIKG